MPTYREHVGDDTETLVVAAGPIAWPEYQRYGAYICQADRSFRSTYYMAFYANQHIQPYLARIEHVMDDLVLTEEEVLAAADLPDDVRQRLLQLVRVLVDEREERRPFKVMLLSRIGSPDTKELTRAIKNDLRSKTGSPVAFTMGQRYVLTECLLQAPRNTSELLRFGGVQQ